MALFSWIKIGVVAGIVGLIAFLYIHGEFLSKDLKLETAKVAQEKANADLAATETEKWKKVADQQTAAAASKELLNQQLNESLEKARAERTVVTQTVIKYIPVKTACDVPTGKLLPQFAAPVSP